MEPDVYSVAIKHLLRNFLPLVFSTEVYATIMPEARRQKDKTNQGRKNIKTAAVNTAFSCICAQSGSEHIGENKFYLRCRLSAES